MGEIMTSEVKVSVTNVVGNSLCVASSDGDKLYEHIVPALEAGQCVRLSFRDVTLLTSAFLNGAIGRLYGKFSEEEIRSRLKVEDVEQDDMQLIKAVADNAKQYFKDPQKYRQAVMAAEDS